MSNQPPEPVKPIGMELVFFYPCPFCHRELPQVAQAQAAMLTCDVCRQKFPVVPIDESTIQFIKLMLADGPAAIDPDYL